jgi:NTE family protein
MPRADLVLEGGGVKGLGTAGAVMRLLERGYEFERVAGTSVGALTAAFVAAGADASTLTRLIGRLRLANIPDRAPPGVPVLSEGLSLINHNGAYRGDYLRDWLSAELRELGVTTFATLRRRERGDDPALPQYRLVVTATDVTHGRLVRLPWDYHQFGLDPDEQLVADAVRMSLSIPCYFRPCTLGDSTIVDGGVLSNFAIDIFDRTDDEQSRWPTFGVRLLPDLPAGMGKVSPFLGFHLPPPFELLKQVVVTAFVGHDQTHLNRPHVRERTMTVDTAGVGITEFDLSNAKRALLLHRGRVAADEFLAGWHRDRPQPIAVS